MHDTKKGGGSGREPEARRGKPKRRRSIARTCATVNPKSTIILLRDQRQPASTARRFEHINPREALQAALAADHSDLRFPVLEIVCGDIVFVDADTHTWPHKPSAEELDAFAAAAYPRPDVWWWTHGLGLRLVYLGRDARSRAAAACLSLPKAFAVELKSQSRHPGGAHPDYPGATAGPVVWTPESERRSFDWQRVGRPDAKAVTELLERIGLRLGERYDHERCPIAGDQPSDARDCVCVYETGVMCFRCRSKDIRMADDLHPGFAPYSVLGGTGSLAALPVRLARNLVHWEHARCHLGQEHPNIPPGSLREIYHSVLRGIHGPRDLRVDMVFNPDLRLLLTDAGPIDSTGYRLLKLTNDTFDALPCVHELSRASTQNAPELTLRGALRDGLRNSLLPDGYTPVRVVRGLAFKEDAQHITVTLPPREGDPVQLLPDAELLAEDVAITALQAAFPDLDIKYLYAILAGRICAEHGGRPPILLAVGPTGSGKGEIPRVAASFLGDDRVNLTVVNDEERMMRQIGAALTEGRRFLFLDELLRR